MKKSLIVLTSVAAACLVCGCAGLFGKGVQRHGRSSSLVEFLYPGGAPPVQPTVPVLDLPLTVGVAFLPPVGGPASVIDEADKQAILQQVQQRFSQRGFVREIVAIPDYYLSSQRGFEGLAGIQRLYDLDLVALVSYDQVSRQHGNELSLTYLTIVGAYLFPGTSQDVHTVVDLAVVDPATRSLVIRAAGMDSRGGVSNEVRAGARLQQRGSDSLQAAGHAMVANFDAELLRFEDQVRAGTARVKIANAGGGGSVDRVLLALLAILYVFRHAHLRLPVQALRSPLRAGGEGR